MTMQEILRFNPWWQGRAAINADSDLLAFEGERIKYLPKLEVKRGVCILRGPRQVGKTTLLKLKIRKLLEEGVEPKSVFFYSFDLAKKAEDIYSVIMEYLETIAPKGKKFLFLDEITGVENWAKAIKLIVDRGDLDKKKDLIVVSGSSPLDLKNEGERLPGRGVEGQEFEYYPCSFGAYLKLKGIEIETADPFLQDKFIEAARKNLPHLLKLKREFYSYLESGGFLYAINHGKDELTMERYARWLEGDFAKAGKNPLILKEILQAVIKKAGSQFSYHSIAKETSVSSHNTIIEYMNLLSDERFLMTANKVSLPFNVERRKERKAYFLDPLLVAIAQKWAGINFAESVLVEQAVMSHLARIGDACFYNDGKREIDCIVKRGEDLVGVEVKWSSKLVPSDGYVVLKTKKPYLLGKETFGKVGRVNAIPACLFLAMLEIEEITKRDVLKLA